jgi:hypothetical protein
MFTNSSVTEINKIKKTIREAINFDHSVHWGNQTGRGCRAAAPSSKKRNRLCRRDDMKVLHELGFSLYQPLKSVDE